MPAEVVHLVRHGEVTNPDRILYGRLDGFGLTPRGHQMAETVAQYFADRPISAVLASPLLRAQQTATPIAAAHGLDIITDDRLIEGTNIFEGTRVSAKAIMRNPSVWPKLWNPFRPSWGESYKSILQRMMAAISDAAENHQGEVVVVSHQLPIWMVHRHVNGESLVHSPKARRCTLCSVTSFQPEQEPGPGQGPTKTFADDSRPWREVAYVEPAASLLADAVDLGAV
ncbi:histidine phosphatase family protein [Pontimonas sp.]|uniref:histidine phosphatase family protein n=1 Tax=Pontimonas sp. TaxID=2304492 RepID=UPI00286FC78B|nr:histidine phosphatase family protein [Pontimonas sp.]MDR9397314.1 histidine phosphatase family protein [Pontimonas sp.]